MSEQPTPDAATAAEVLRDVEELLDALDKMAHREVLSLNVRHAMGSLRYSLARFPRPLEVPPNPSL